MTLLRIKGSRALSVKVNQVTISGRRVDIKNPEKVADALRHGDLVIEADTGLTYILSLAKERSFRPVERSTVPLEVTEAIEDPVELYGGVEGVDHVELSHTRHAALILGASGGRAVNPARPVLYSVAKKKYLVEVNPRCVATLDAHTRIEYIN
jgi:hypothetical protein